MHPYTTDTCWIAASDRADLARILRDGGYDEPEEDAREAGRLDPDEPVSMGQWSDIARRPPSAETAPCEPFGDNWTIKATAPASVWAAWAAEQGDDYGARCGGSTEYGP